MRKKMSIKVLMVTFVLALSAAWQAEATIVTNIITTFGDANIKNPDPNLNYGTETSLSIMDYATSARKSYIHFDLSTVPSPEIESASLTLQIQSTAAVSDYSINVYGLNNGNAGESWIETGITWNNAPENDTANTMGGLLSGVTYLGKLVMTSVTNGSIVTFSAPELTAFLSADTDNLVTLILADASVNAKNFTFYSKEGTGKTVPTLTLTSSIPEPTTLSLMILSMTGAMLVRKVSSNSSR